MAARLSLLFSVTFLSILIIDMQTAESLLVYSRQFLLERQQNV